MMGKLKMKGVPEKYSDKDGRWNPDGTCAKLMSFMVKHSDVVFTSSTLSRSLKMFNPTVRTNVKFLHKFNCLKSVVIKEAKNDQQYFQVDCDIFFKFNNMIPD